MNCLRQNQQNNAPIKAHNLDLTPINEKKKICQLNNDSQKYLTPPNYSLVYSTQPSFRSPMSSERSNKQDLSSQIKYNSQFNPSLTTFEEEFEDPQSNQKNIAHNFKKKENIQDPGYFEQLFTQKADSTSLIFNQLNKQFSDISLEDQTIGSSSSGGNNYKFYSDQREQIYSDFISTPTQDHLLQSNLYWKKDIINSNSDQEELYKSSSNSKLTSEEDNLDYLQQRFQQALEVSDFTEILQKEETNIQNHNNHYNFTTQIPESTKNLKDENWKENLGSPDRLGFQAGFNNKNKTYIHYENQLGLNSSNQMTSIWKSSKQKISKKKVDRFIPSRKTSKLNVALSQAHEVKDKNNYKDQLKGEFYDKQCQTSIEELYKCHILGIQTDSQKTPFGMSQSQFSQYFANNGSTMVPPRYINNKNNNQQNENSNEPIMPLYICGDENEVSRTIKSYSNQNMLRFKDSPNKKKIEMGKYLPEYNNKYSLIDNQNSCIFDFKRKEMRKISKIPFKVLDAPSLQDDFYLNLVDWSSTNILAVALGSCVYLWKAENNKVIKFCDLGNSASVTSVAWHPKGHQLSLGTSTGQVQIWDADSLKQIRSYDDHEVRVGSLSWSTSILACGSRDKTISMRDTRDPTSNIRKLHDHKQEVCGLKWSFDEQQLASGGNDNKLYVWNNHSNIPICKFSQHTAAVKAIAWSPHQHGLLASGGGTQDRCIRFWNTQTSSCLDYIDTQSQVCNLMFGKTENEIVSTHGYSQNQIIVWKYPSMQKITELTGHTSRVLYLAMSPDGSTIVTGAGDETLRFWNVFPSVNDGYKPQSLLVSDVRDLR